MLELVNIGWNMIESTGRGWSELKSAIMGCMVDLAGIGMGLFRILANGSKEYHEGKELVTK